ncbi:restriction endonuclease subunit S [Yersinia aldovae]|uniref:restriction endonuclease subunit S n=1 Tax=Yersinia aldovae TaxID=29483 RepID=UPI0011A9E32D|nr:restriction endonuclease subunit S [Yersinia aldovae]
MVFKTERLEELCELVIDCPHSTPKWTDSGFIVLRNQNIRDGILDLATPSFTDEAGYKSRIKRAIPQADDIVFTREAPMGEVCLIPEGLRCCLGQRQVLLRAKKKINPHYLFWALQSSYVQHQISWNEGTGTTVSNVRIPVIKDLKIPRLDTMEDYIASIMDSISMKSLANQQINQTLEQIAQALFKSWFVDFEPVKANIAVLEAGGSQEEATLAAMTAISGKDADSLVLFERDHPEQYAELKATAELFPSAMQDSELGEIPVGWEVGELSDLALLNTSSWTKKNAPESVSYVDLANTKWGVINSVEEFIFSDAPSRARRILKSLDTIIGTVRPGNGSYAYINKDGLTGSTGFAVLTPKQEIFSEYIYLCATSKESIERLAHLADGGAYPAVNADVVLSTQCVIPSEQKDLESLLREFSSKTKNIFSYSSHNLEQNIILSQIRDTLLPKLLSGEITLPEAETWAAQVDTQEA